jgi:hypothetical protein
MHLSNNQFLRIETKTTQYYKMFVAPKTIANKKKNQNNKTAKQNKQQSNKQQNNKTTKTTKHQNNKTRLIKQQQKHQKK